MIRPRVEAELVRIVEIAEVQRVGYDAGSQRLEAVISDAQGVTATVLAEYRSVCPGALDALAEVLGNEPQLISGSLRRARGGLVIDPIAIMTASGVVVPDLAAGDGGVQLGLQSEPSADALTEALDTGLARLASPRHGSGKAR